MGRGKAFWIADYRSGKFGRGFFVVFVARVPSQLTLSEASVAELGINSWMNESRIEQHNPDETTFFFNIMWLLGEIDPQLVNPPTRDVLAH